MSTRKDDKASKGLIVNSTFDAFLIRVIELISGDPGVSNSLLLDLYNINIKL